MIQAELRGLGAIDYGARSVPSWSSECGRVRVALSTATTVKQLKCYAARFYEGNLQYANSSAEPALSRHVNAANVYSAAYYIPEDNPQNSTERNVEAMKHSLRRADQVSDEALHTAGSRDPDYVSPEQERIATHTVESLPIPADALKTGKVATSDALRNALDRMRKRASVSADKGEVVSDTRGKRTVVARKATMTTGAKVGIGLAAAVAITAAVVVAKRKRRRKGRRR